MSTTETVIIEEKEKGKHVGSFEYEENKEEEIEEERDEEKLRKKVVKRLERVKNDYSAYLLVVSNLENWSVVDCNGKQDRKHRCKGLTSEERRKLEDGGEVRFVHCHLAAWVNAI